jgi:hypothetical protein
MRMISLFLAVLVTLGSSDNSRKRSITEPPLDAEDAQRVRIWIGLERVQTCRTTCVIVDMAGDTVRHLFSTPLSPGYYNVYWDKKDDSDRWVEPGKYRYFLHDCMWDKSGTLQAVYKQWERRSTMAVVQDKDRTQYIRLELLDDSARVTLAFLDRDGDTAAAPIRDSIMSAGVHEIRPDSTSGLKRGKYEVRLRVGDFVHDGEFRYRR